MSDGSSAILVLRMLFSLVIVLAALLVLVRFLQRRQGGGGFRNTRKANVPVRVLTRQSLSRGASIQVVEIGRETLVLGVTDSAVNVLRTLPVDQVLGETVEAHQSEPAPGTTSDAPLAALLGKGKAAHTAQQAFDLMLGRVAGKQADQAGALAAELSPEMSPAPTPVLTPEPMTRRGRHRG